MTYNTFPFLKTILSDKTNHDIPTRSHQAIKLQICSVFNTSHLLRSLPVTDCRTLPTEPRDAKPLATRTLVGLAVPQG